MGQPLHFTEAILKAANELEIRARRNVTALLSGNYRSAFRGSGMQFKEFRQYEPGDDIRHMSWSATARTGKATLKVYEEERELDVVIAVDVSGSSLFGFSKKRKIDVYGELLALLGLAAIRSGDNLGAFFFSDQPQKFLPPSRTRMNLLVALRELLSQPLESRRSDLRAPLKYLDRLLPHRTILILISDFLIPDFQTELLRLSKRHEVILIHCTDDAERGQGLSGVFEVADPETGETYLLDGNSPKVRERLANYQKDLRLKLEALCQSTRSDYLSMNMEDDYVRRIIQFFRQRGPSRI